MQNRFYSKGIIVNIDIDTVTVPFLNSAMEDECVIKETLYPFVDQYKDIPGSQVKVLAFDIFCQYSAVDSETWTDYFSKWNQKTENGVKVDYHEQYKAIVKFNKEYDLDPYDIWFKRTRELGMEAWMSIRMNDCHYPDAPASCIRSEFFYQARENGWMIGDHYGYFRHCFDYAVPEVQKRMLAYIEEQLGRYDVDALEMDFMREVYCFDYLNQPDCAAIMNDFVRNVKKIVDEAGKKWGHRIKLTARIMRDIEQNLVFGFDVATWAKEGLVDHINIAPRWETCDSDMPIAEWKVRFPEIEISPGIETLACRMRYEDSHATSDVVNGLAANYISQGADYIYMFNHFLNPRDLECELAKRSIDCMARCGLSDTVFKSPRRHIVMYQDIAPEGYKRYKPLPMMVEGSEKTIEISTGYIPDGKNGRLIVGLSEGCPDCVKISVNGTICKNFKPTVIYSVAELAHTNTTNKYVEDNVNLYECEIELGSSEKQIVSFEAVKACVDYVEIVV